MNNENNVDNNTYSFHSVVTAMERVKITLWFENTCFRFVKYNRQHTVISIFL